MYNKSIDLLNKIYLTALLHQNILLSKTFCYFRADGISIFHDNMHWKIHIF